MFIGKNAVKCFINDTMLLSSMLKKIWPLFCGTFGKSHGKKMALTFRYRK